MAFRTVEVQEETRELGRYQRYACMQTYDTKRFFRIRWIESSGKGLDTIARARSLVHKPGFHISLLFPRQRFDGGSACSSQ